jgi:flavin reductase (DIM6/NTAB) family NADH-FMN oxidoreductase RutF
MTDNEDFQRQYRNTIGLFATGVTVVVAGGGDDVRGMTANAVTSVSLEPTMLLFCPGKEARLSKYCEVGKPFTVNILSAEQQNTSNHFAGADMAPEHGFVDWPEAGGPPRIDGCIAAVACEIREMFDGGDHWIVLGEVKALHRGDDTDDPLLFYAGAYRTLADQED